MHKSLIFSQVPFVVSTHVRERLYFSAVTSSTFSWKESEGAVTGFLILLIENIRIVCWKTVVLIADLTVTGVIRSAL